MELLIAIVVVAIIATIVLVSYRGIQGRANDVAVMSDLEHFSAAMAGNTYRDGLALIGETSTPGVPSAEPLKRLGWKASKDSYDTSAERNLAFCYNYPLGASIHADWGTPMNGRHDWALVALSKTGAVFYVSDKKSVPTQYTRSTPMIFDAAENVCGVVISELGADGFTSVFHGYNKTDTTTGPWREWAGGN